MAKPRQPDPEVLESDYRVPAALGTAAWTVALVVLLAMGDRLTQQWWIWVCVIGISLGLFGFGYIPRLLRKRTRDDHERTAVTGEDPGVVEQNPPSGTLGDSDAT